MKQFFFIVLLTCLALGIRAQQQPVPDKRVFRIVDTLTAQEKLNRNPVVLQSEIDSIIKLHDQQQAQLIPDEPIKPAEASLPAYWLWIAIGSMLVVAVLLYSLLRNQQRFNGRMTGLQKQLKQLEWTAHEMDRPVSTPVAKGKTSVASLEKKISSLTAELEKKEKQNEGLEIVMSEYRQIKQEFEMVKQQMMDVYKIRNYPGYAKDKSETEILTDLINTERSVALYAYEHFLKPVISIADANKNNPAKISGEEKDRMLDLLLSLALLYSEYLYLRVNELSVGGKMVERIAGLRNGNSVDLTLLKELNLEHGSRALALRMVLDKMGISHLSYPVFDETNLNLS